MMSMKSVITLNVFIFEMQCQATTGEGSMPTALKVNVELRDGFCKLLLPNGQYQVVDVKKPGLYRKYDAKSSL